MDRRRVAGIALLVAGAALVLGARSAWPEPTWMEALRPGEPVPASVLARGPAVTRYDAANDSTLALFECVHGHCGRAIAIRGDARGAASSDGMLLRPVPPSGRLSTAPLDAPLAAGPFAVTERFAPAFEPAPRLPGAAARVAGVAAALAGVAVALGSWRGVVGAAASALALWAGLATNDGGAVILLQLAGVPLSLVLAGVLAAVPRARSWWPAPLAYLPLLVGSFAAGAPAFFPLDAP